MILKTFPNLQAFQRVCYIGFTRIFIKYYVNGKIEIDSFLPLLLLLFVLTRACGGCI